MMQTEFVRSLNCNYERILLDNKPEEKRYQYCIMNRGGIRGLLPCSLRYINGFAYLYYDISSRQNVKQLYGTKCITRARIKDFIWSLQQVRQELERFLLDAGNLLFYPEQIFQDLESSVFYFLYIPYYEGESGLKQLLEFWVERIDYDDEVLVDCVYHMYEQVEQNGELYLQTQIFEDAEKLNEETVLPCEETACNEAEAEVTADSSMKAPEMAVKEIESGNTALSEQKSTSSEFLTAEKRETENCGIITGRICRKL